VGQAPLSTDHKLLPHEWWLAALVLARQSAHSTPVTVKMQQNWDPEGIVLISAATADGVLAPFFVLTSVVLMIGSRFNGAPAIVGYLMFVPIVGVGSLGIARNRQAITVGRKFRGGRPFQR
jgi:hypothetical protein